MEYDCSPETPDTRGSAIAFECPGYSVYIARQQSTVKATAQKVVHQEDWCIAIGSHQPDRSGNCLGSKVVTAHGLQPPPRRCVTLQVVSEKCERSHGQVRSLIRQPAGLDRTGSDSQIRTSMAGL